MFKGHNSVCKIKFRFLERARWWHYSIYPLSFYCFVCICVCVCAHTCLSVYIHECLCLCRGQHEVFLSFLQADLRNQIQVAMFGNKRLYLQSHVTAPKKDIAYLWVFSWLLSQYTILLVLFKYNIATQFIYEHALRDILCNIVFKDKIQETSFKLFHNMNYLYVDCLF